MELQEEQLVVGSRYVTGAGLVILLYNHLLTLDDEVKYIWNAKWSTLKTLFLVLRYVIPSSIVWHNRQLSMIEVTNLSLPFCRIWFITAIIICVTTTGPMHFFLMLRLWLLSRRNRSLVFVTLGAFILTQMAIVAFAIAVSIKTTPFIKSTKFPFLSPNNRICFLQERDILWTPFAPGMIFEIFGLTAILLHSLWTYKKDKTRFQSIIRCDVVREVLPIFCLTTAKFLVTVLVPLSVVFYYVIFLWCGTTILVTKMIIQRRQHAAVQGEFEVSTAKGQDNPNP